MCKLHDPAAGRGEDVMIQIEDVSAVGSDSMRVMQELRDSGLSVVQLMHRPTWKQERVERALVSGVFVCVYL